MRLRVLGFLVAATLVLPAAFSDQIGPGGTWNGTSFGTLFTPPMTDGQQFVAPIEDHVTTSYGNWVGVHFGLNYDPTEVNFVGVTAAPGFTATSPGGAVATIWNPGGAMQLPAGSAVFPVANVTFDAKNTTTANNGDVDITFDGGGTYGRFNIYGATPFAPWTTQVGPSNMLYVGFTAGGQPKTASQWAPLAQGAGTWIHATAWKTVVMLPSMWWGRPEHLIGQGGIGVEHVPEPTAAVLLAAGIGTLVVARRRGKA